MTLGAIMQQMSESLWHSLNLGCTKMYTRNVKPHSTIS